MFGQTPRPVAEHDAGGDTARIYHEIRQSLRVTGVNLNFRTWAGFPHFFPAMWAGMQPIAGSRGFESAADRVRTRAADLAIALPPLQVSANLGGSQRYQIERALALYHYINPKLLVFTVLVNRSLGGERSAVPGQTARAAMVPFGPPPDMAAMEMVDEQPGDARLRRLFRDITRTLDLPSVNSDYRTLALWPDFLEPAWAALKPITRSDAFRTAATALAQDAAAAASRLTAPAIDLRRLKARGEHTKALLDVSSRFERLLPGLILTIALLGRDWWSHDRLRQSPFPIGEQSAVRPRGAR